MYSLLAFMGNMIVFTTISLSVFATTYYSDRSFITGLWQQINERNEDELDHDEKKDIHEINHALHT